MEKNNEHFCFLCMEYHPLKKVEVKEKTIFKNQEIEYISKKLLCEKTDEYLIPEDLINENDIRMKDAYREKVGLKTSKEINDIRKKYALSGKELSRVLSWGELTLTRYENHHVQDRAHDDILSEIQENPEFLYKRLIKNKDTLSEKSYKKTMIQTKQVLYESSNIYKINSITSNYNDFASNTYQGNKELDITLVIEVINYLASKVDDLYLVKLMKLLWYSDFLNYKLYNQSITGQEYFKHKMGALAKNYDLILSLDGITYKEEYICENISKKFSETKNFNYTLLTSEHKSVLAFVIDKLGKQSTKDIVNRMHDEDAYKCTMDSNPISYEYAKSLKLNINF
ncbi:MAG: DUF4065 domain-containing protein [Tenericutes bacterium]|nr:DUF4065 domain-containing protein [Mycoplasmatota bacterium]